MVKYSFDGMWGRGRVENGVWVQICGSETPEGEEWAHLLCEVAESR